MSDFEELSFVIPGHTPETMPLDRLIEYLQQMAIVLGDPSQLHLVEIRHSSVSPVLRAPKIIALEAREMAARVQSGQGTLRQLGAYDRIRRMVRSDAEGTHNLEKYALLKVADKVVLEIPPAPDEMGTVENLRQATYVDGQVIKVGGAGEDAALQLQGLDGRILSGFIVKRHLAKELAQLLWGPPVRLNGVGIWCRDIDGVWRLVKMRVQSYEQLEDDDAVSTLERLRSLKVDWPNDTYEKLSAEREGLQ